MRFEKIIPTPRLSHYVQYLVISEHGETQEYKVFPGTGLVIGFQYKGKLSVVQDRIETGLATAGITGLSDNYKVFKSSAGIGTILVFFTETGISHFSTTPAHELFNQSIALDNIFSKAQITTTEEQLAYARSDAERIQVVERFLLSVLKEKQADQLIVEAVRLIYQSKGAIRIKELSKALLISQSPFEKRFRKIVGTSPKKFASIVRFNAVLNNMDTYKSLTELCFEYNFFDQAHFIKDFKQYTGDTPENFKRLL
jgi:AraC-like DNA-binding protein